MFVLWMSEDNCRRKFSASTYSLYFLPISKIFICREVSVLAVSLGSDTKVQTAHTLTL